MAIDAIVMKVYEYNEADGSLVVAFKSATNEANIDDMPKVAYQPNMFEEQDPTLVIKRIAQAGVSLTEMQERQLQLMANPVTKEFYKNAVGNVYNYTVAELYGPQHGQTVIEL